MASGLRRRKLLQLAGAAVSSSLLLPHFIEAATAAGSPVTLGNGRTMLKPMLGLAPGRTDYEIVPLVSSSDNVPLLTGTWPDLTPHAELTYGITGAPDGMAVLDMGDHYYMWLHHELVGDKDDEDYVETKFSNTIEGMVPGARISLLKLDKTWNVIGGTQLVREYRPTTWLMNDDGTTPRVAPGSKITIDEAARTYTHEGHVPSDFCGGTLAETGFVNPATGKEEPVWFADEENAGYSGVAWACFPDGVAYPLEGLGLYEKETTLSLRNYRPKTHGLTILVGTEDDDDSEVYLWVGTPTTEDPNGFVTGQLYAMKIDGAARESGPGRFDNQPAADKSTPEDGASVVGKVGDSKACTWTAVPRDATRTIDSLDGFCSTVTDGKRNATSFLALEDLNEDMTVADRLWIAADGGAGSEVYDDDAPRYENPMSRLYRLDLGIKDPADPSTWSTTIFLAAEGGAGNGVSYDNVAPGTHGKVLVAEDWDQGSDEADAVWDVLKKEQRPAGLYEYDIESGKMAPAFFTTQETLDPDLAWSRLNQLIADGKESEARDDQDFWETSGMVEVPEENRNGKSAWLITVQAHSLETDGYSEGGQVVLARPIA